MFYMRNEQRKYIMNEWNIICMRKYEYVIFWRKIYVLYVEIKKEKIEKNGAVILRRMKYVLY